MSKLAQIRTAYSNLIVPTVHLNGDSKRALHAQYEAAEEAVYEAINALNEITVHGRDYCPQGNDAINDAVEQHRQFRQALHTVKTHLSEIACAIEAQ